MDPLYTSWGVDPTSPPFPPRPPLTPFAWQESVLGQRIPERRGGGKRGPSGAGAHTDAGKIPRERATGGRGPNRN